MKFIPFLFLIVAGAPGFTQDAETAREPKTEETSESRSSDLEAINANDATTDEADTPKLDWKEYSDDEYDKVCFEKPTIVLIMKDLCPGCTAAREKLWNSKVVVEVLNAYDLVLFRGNAAETKGLEEQISTRFDAKELPVTIIRNTGMADEPVLMYRFPNAKLLAEKVNATLSKESPKVLNKVPEFKPTDK